MMMLWYDTYIQYADIINAPIFNSSHYLGTYWSKLQPSYEVILNDPQWLDIMGLISDPSLNTTETMKQSVTVNIYMPTVHRYYHNVIDRWAGLVRFLEYDIGLATWRTLWAVFRIIIIIITMRRAGLPVIWNMGIYI